MVRLVHYGGILDAHTVFSNPECRGITVSTAVKKKILVVEDDPDIRVMLGFILEDDYDVVLCPDGRSGIKAALEEFPDLILLDIYMAGMSGLDVCNVVRETSSISSTPIIFVTAGALREEVAEGIARGADDIIFKPFDPEELVKKIEKLI